MNFWRPGGNPNHWAKPAAADVAGGSTRDINGRLGFTVDDSNVYGIAPKKKSLYEDDSMGLSNNDYERANADQTREVPRGRQAEADTLRRMFARAEHKFAKGRLAIGNNPKLGSSISAPAHNLKRGAMQGNGNSLMSPTMMTMGFDSNNLDERGAVSRRNDPLAKANHNRRVTMGRGASPSSMKRTTFKAGAGGGSSKRGHSKKRNTIFAKRNNTSMRAPSPGGPRQTIKPQVAFAHQPLVGQVKNNAWGSQQRSARSPMHSSPLQDILKLDANKMTEDMRKRPTFKQPTNFFSSSAPASSWTMQS